MTKEKTFRQWISELPKDIQQPVRTNLHSSACGGLCSPEVGATLESTRCYPNHQFLAAAFDWENSPQGYAFWERQYEALCD